MNEGVEDRADFSQIRYAQVWEDADVLLPALSIQAGDRCLAIASGGDNALAMLTADPSLVVAVDLSPAQLACLALRIAAFRVLSHAELLALIGSRAHSDRWSLYLRCREHGGLEPEYVAFWDRRRADIDAGIGSAGKFERYFAVFRRWILPLVHSRRRSLDLLKERSDEERLKYYEQSWNNVRWRLMFRMFFSRAVMGRFGRDPEFFRYVEGDVGARILGRARYAMTMLAPHENPYMHWILTGTHGDALPLALRAEHFEDIRDRVDRIVMVRGTLLDGIASGGAQGFDRFNLSDVFEYMSNEETDKHLRAIADSASRGARLVYWNMLVPRACPETLAHCLRSIEDEANKLFAKDKAFFYSRLVIEEVVR